MKAAKKWHYFRIALILGSNVELTDLYVLLWGFKQRVNINLVISILKIPLTSNTDDTFLGLLSAFEQVPGISFPVPDPLSARGFGLRSTLKHPVAR